MRSNVTVLPADIVENVMDTPLHSFVFPLHPCHAFMHADVHKVAIEVLQYAMFFKDILQTTQI